jgi:hypothetical protein
MRDKVRVLAGVPDTGQISDANLNGRINDYYMNRLPFVIQERELEGTYTQALVATDSGKYTIDATKLVIDEDIFLNGEPVTLTRDRKQFFLDYPKDLGAAYVISDAGAVLTKATESVSYSAVKYNVDGNAYALAAGSIALSGDTIPQNLYGAWRLEVDEDGDVSIVEADDNATGYATPALAIKGLINEATDAACLGFVTAMSTDSGGFIPGTTSLSAATVTSTVTDGYHSTRRRPDTFLLYGDTLYAGPKPDDTYELVIPYIEKRDALTQDTDVPSDVRWGNLIAYGTAIEIMQEDGDIEGAMMRQGTFNQLKNEINAKSYRQDRQTRRAQAEF